MLLAELTGNEQRYRLLESSREYAQDKLVAHGEQENVARRHALFYVELGERLERAWDTTPDRQWLPQAQAESENWRAALEFSLAKQRDVILGQRLAALYNLVWRTFTLTEGRHWVRAALELVNERTAPALAARLEHAEAHGAQQFNECNVTLAAADRALMQYRELGDVLGAAQARSLSGGALLFLGRPLEAEPLLREALETARTLGDRRLAATVLAKLGQTRSAVGDFGEARAYFIEALAFAKLFGADFLAASVAACLAECEFKVGDSQATLQLMADVLATYRGLNSAAPGLATELINMAGYLVRLGRYDEARVHVIEALELARGLRMVVLVANSLEHLVVVALLRSRVEGRRTSLEYAGAARLIGFAHTHRNLAGIESSLGQAYDRSGARARVTLAWLALVPINSAIRCADRGAASVPDGNLIDVLLV